MRCIGHPRRLILWSPLTHITIGLLIHVWAAAGNPAVAQPASGGTAFGADTRPLATTPAYTENRIESAKPGVKPRLSQADDALPSTTSQPEAGDIASDGLDALINVVNGSGQGYTAPMTPGTWRTLGSPLAETCRPYAEQADFTSGQDDCVRGLHAWQTMAWDRERYLYARGGGHNSYEGNEIYRFDLATGTWQRMTTSGKAVPREGNRNYQPLYDDGSPSSAHHYGHLVWARDRLVMGPLLGFGGDSERVPYIFTWTPKGGYNQIADTRELSGRFDRIGICSDVDPVNGDVLLSSAGMRRIDPTTGDVTYLGNFVNSDLSDSACLYDPNSKTFYDWKNGTLHTARVGSAGLSEVKRYRRWGKGDKLSDRAGMALGPQGKIWLWDDGRSVYVWDQSKLPDKDIIELRNEKSKEDPTGCGGNDCSRGTGSSAGNYGKWWFVEKLGVFIGFSDHTEPMWVYRPPETIPDTDSRKAELQKQGYTCADTVLGWECPNLQRQVDAGTVQKGVYIDGAKISRDVDFNGSWIKGAVKNRKAALIAEPGAVIRNVKITDASTGLNAACVRPQARGGRVELHNVTCRDSDMGIQGNAEEILIADSTIGQTLDHGRNLGHVLYLCGGASADRCSVTIRNSRIYGPGDGGHTLKTGASRTVLVGVILDETRGKGSRLIDAINGGFIEIQDSRLIAARNDGNRDVIGYDYEARSAHGDNLIVIESSVIDCAGGRLITGRNSFAEVAIRQEDNQLASCE